MLGRLRPYGDLDRSASDLLLEDGLRPRLDPRGRRFGDALERARQRLGKRLRRREEFAQAGGRHRTGHYSGSFRASTR